MTDNTEVSYTSDI